MGRLSATFANLRKKGEKALVTFITAGDPNLAVTEEMIPELAAAGADIIELGVPFSDPMADGPTIQKSSERALSSGTSLAKILAMVKSVRLSCQVPIVLMGYYNPVLIYGPERFASDAVAAGVDGVLLVDLPPEEAGAFQRTARREGLDVIFLLSPTSDEMRIGTVSKMGRGFIYYVSVTGVTGVRKSVDTDLFQRVREIREKIRLPLVVGFGISDPAQAREVAAVADGVVVGSALVKIFEEAPADELRMRVRSFVSALKMGMSPGND